MQEIDAIVDRAHSFIRAHTRGDMRFDEHVRDVKYVVAPNGRLILPAMVAMLQTVDTVLFIPACEEGAMEIMLTLDPFTEQSSEGGALADRWRIYHGEPDDVQWATALIDAARFEGAVIDGEALMRENPLRESEAALCREMNQQHRDDLRLLCKMFAYIEVEDPVMAGIDPLGVDVRGRFDVVRVPFREIVENAEAARDVLQEMIAEAKDGRGPA